MKNFSLLLVFICFAIFGVMSQNNDPNAAALLEKVSNKYKAYKTSKIDVKLTIKIPEVDETIEKEGSAWLKGDAFKIDFEEKMIVSNTETQWTYLKEVNEVQISNYDPSTMIFLPSKIFNLYSEEYIYRIKEDYKNEKGELIKKIELSPVDKESSIFKIVVTVNTSNLNILETKMFEKSGIKYAYKILKIEKNIKLDDGFFVFNIKDFDIDEDDITDLR